MGKAEITTARLPRGTKPVSQAFFTALETIPEASRAAVAKAAQAMIRDQIKMQREKTKAATALERVSKPVVETTAKKAAPNAADVSAPKKGRPRKTAKGSATL